MKTVTFQGERGAYSEDAILKFFGSEVKVLPVKTITDVFKEVGDRRSDFGVVPIENSIEGGINETFDTLLESKLKVVGEINQRVLHCLITLPETGFHDVHSIYSHPQALAQCRNFLSSLGHEVLPAYDTAGSVKMIKEKKLKGVAAVASERAAAIYQMKILRKGIEDHPNNYTRFFVVSYHAPSPTGKDKTSIAFSIGHTPGALFNVLGKFASNNINLTMIISRPTKGTPWEYMFFVDFDGHIVDPLIQEGLESLKGATSFIKIFGSYPSASD